MKLIELFDELAQTTLSNVYLGEGGSILEDFYPKFVAHTNAGLRQLYTRFPLRKEWTTITITEGIDLYEVSSDLVQLLTVMDQTGRLQVINSVNNRDSFFIKNGKYIKIPDVKPGTDIKVEYQAYHPTFTVDMVDDSNHPLELPLILVEPLKQFISYLYYTSLNTEGSTLKAQEYLQVYTALCDETEQSNSLGLSETLTPTKFGARGFV